MARLIWEDRPYEIGVDRGVYYPPGGQGVAWNGLVSVEESSSESGDARYQDGVRLSSKRVNGSFGATIEAFTYPPSFDEHLGLYDGLISRRRQGTFDFSYRVATEKGYKIHLVYNATAAPSSKDYKHDDVSTFSWDITTKPIFIEDAAPSAHLVVDAGLAYSQTISDLEAVLYGSDEFDPRMPTVEEVLLIFEANALLKVYEIEPGLIEIDAPDLAMTMIDETTVEIDWPSVVRLDTDTYSIYSY